MADNMVLVATGDKTGFLTGGGALGLTSGDIAINPYFQELDVDFNLSVLSGGTAPTVGYTIKRKGLDGVYYQVDAPTALSAVGTIIRTLGKGSAQNIGFGLTIQIVIAVTGTPTTATWTMSIIGK